jgi:hypothetical protein
MAKLTSVSLYDVYKLTGEDRAMAVKKLLSIESAINEIGETYINFSDNAKNAEMLDEERKSYIKEQGKVEKDFDITLAAYTFLRFGATIEAKLEELIDNIKSIKDEQEETIR